MNHLYRNAHVEAETILVDPREAARLLRVSERTLWNISHRDREIPFLKLGKLVRYQRTDLLAWAASKLAVPAESGV